MWCKIQFPLSRGVSVRALAELPLLGDSKKLIAPLWVCIVDCSFPHYLPWDPDPTVSRFGEPKKRQAFLRELFHNQATELHSPFHSGIEIDEYQLDPEFRVLSMPRVILLVADDVGLGKNDSIRPRGAGAFTPPSRAGSY